VWVWVWVYVRLEIALSQHVARDQIGCEGRSVYGERKRPIGSDQKIMTSVPCGPRHLLELFAGTKSVGKVASAPEFGYDVVSVDIDATCAPTICTDILKWEYTQFPVGHFDIIWASPPCATFSNLRCSWVGREMTRAHPGTTFTQEMLLYDEKAIGLTILRQTLIIIEYLKPRFFFVENPQTGRMKKYMYDLPFVDVCYCEYGFDYKKPTRIWTNCRSFIYGDQARMCTHLERHTRTIGGKHTMSVRQKYAIPPQLVRACLLACG